MEEIKLNITTEQKEVIIRTGDATPIEMPKSVKLTGTLDAPYEFFEKRKKTINIDNAHVEVDYQKQSIKLVIDENMPTNKEILGTLQLFDEFKQLGINTTKTYSITSLREILKFKGAFFKSKDEYRTIIGNLVNFSAKIEKEFNNSNDFKGNAAQQTVTKMKTDIPLNFKLNMPVLLGYPNMEFEVDVCVDATSGDLKLWLECIELKNDLDAKIVEIIDKQQLNFASELVVITVG